MLGRSLRAAPALALLVGAVAWALAGLPGAPAACPAGGCDCELARPGAIGQPANAWSSLALGAAGTLLLAFPPSVGEMRGRALRHALAAYALAFAGAAAFLFHAGLTAWAARLDGIAAGTLVAALLVHRWWPGAIHRRPARRPLRAAPPWAILALGGLCWWLGHSGGPWCRPASPLQAHAAWHFLAAAALLFWLWPRRPAAANASRIPSRPLPSRPEDDPVHEPAP